MICLTAQGSSSSTSLFSRFAPTVRQISSARSMSSRASPQPPWLKSLLSDKSHPPKLYAWCPANLTAYADYEAPNGSSDPSRRIYILGVGNMGRLYASYLARAPNPPPVTLVVHRPEKLSQWMQGPGLELERAGVVDANKGFNIEYWTEDAPDHGPVNEVALGGTLENLIIATKASDALPQMDRLRRYLGPSSTVGFAQNGMNKLWPPIGAFYLLQRYPDGNAPNILHCITTHGVISEGAFRSRHASPADAVVGPVSLNEIDDGSRADGMIGAITSSPNLDARFAPTADLWVLQLEKLVVNSLINPLTALLRCPRNGLIFEDETGILTHVRRRLLSEASVVLQALVDHESSAAILQAASHPKSTLGAKDMKTLRGTLCERFSQARLTAMVEAVGARTAENTSSMMQDVSAGKKTEVRDFNGWLVESGHMLGLGDRVKGHQAIVDLVEAGEPIDKEALGNAILR